MAIQDLVGNPIAAGTTGQVLGYIEPPEAAETLPLRMYRFLLEPIRLEDAKAEGALFVKRFLEGPQSLWATIQARIFALKDLWSITDIEDAHLIYLKRILGWTPEYDSITDALDADQLRKLLATSVRLWKTRGPEDTLISVLQLTTGVRMRIWNWFDFRFVLDETGVGEDHDGRDPWLISLPGPPDIDEYRSNLRIVDDGTLDRDLVQALVRLTRPAGERMEISWIDFLDTFAIEGDLLQWEVLAGTAPTVADGVMTFINDANVQVIATNVSGDSDWEAQVAFCRIRGDSGSAGSYLGSFGFGFYTSALYDGYAVLLDTFTNSLLFRTYEGGNPTPTAETVVALTDPLHPDTYYGLRVEIQPEGGSNRIKVYLDAEEEINVLSTIHSSGKLALIRDISSTNVQVDEVEMFQLPLETTTVDINP